MCRRVGWWQGSRDQWRPGQSDELADVPISRLAMVSRRATAAGGAGDPRLSERGRAALRRRGVRGFLVAPLVVQGAVFGAVELSDMARERVFSRDEIDLVEAVCRVAGLAMDNAVLFDGLERRNREAELLNEIAARTSASLDMTQIAEAAVAGLKPLVTVSGFGLSLLQADEWRVVYASEPDWMRMQVPGAGAPAGGMLAQLERDAVLIDDRRRRRAAISGHPGEDCRGSKAAIGLFDRERLVGALMLGSETPGAFEAVGRSLLERVGVHLSLAAHNARLYQEIKTLHLGNLKGLSTALNAKDYYTLGHAARVAAYMVLLGRELGWDAGHDRAGARSGLPARHRQDRRVRQGAPQAGHAQRRRVGADAAAPRGERRHHRAALPGGACRRRAPPSRALGRRRAIRTVSPATTSRSSRGRCAWWIPTTPCPCTARTAARAPTRTAWPSFGAAAASSSIPP